MALKNTQNNSAWNDWHQYLAVALVGTQRQTPAAPKGDSAIAALSKQLDWSQPESALLSMAGIVALHEIVGSRPSEQTLPPIEASAPEQRPACNNKLANYLEKALTTYPILMPELLELFIAAGQRAPSKLLPKLLNFGQKRLYLQDEILAVMGDRGAWLATQNPDWSYAAISPATTEEDSMGVDEQQALFQQQWHEGDRTERYAAFTQWRSVEADAAREALSATWESETHTNKKALLPRLKPHLSMADEPFLEATLVDRSKGVREVAAELLATMPNSRLCQRIAERISQFVHFHITDGKTENRQLVLAVSLPEKYDPDWERDGISRKPVEGLGEKAGWLQQLIATTPLSLWPQDFEALSRCLTPEGHTDHPWRTLMLTGWAMAAHKQQRTQTAATWAYALLHQLNIETVGKGEAGKEIFPKETLQSLLRLLPIDQQEAYLRAYLKKSPQTKQKKDADQHLADWLCLIAQVPQRWDYSFSQLALAQVMHLLKKSDRRSGNLYCPPLTLAMTLHPGLAPEANRIITNLAYEQSPTAAWQRFLDEFLPTLSLRWDIYQAFANSS